MLGWVGLKKKTAPRSHGRVHEDNTTGNDPTDA